MLIPCCSRFGAAAGKYGLRFSSYFRGNQNDIRCFSLASSDTEGTQRPLSDLEINSRLFGDDIVNQQRNSALNVQQFAPPLNTKYTSGRLKSYQDPNCLGALECLHCIGFLKRIKRKGSKMIYVGKRVNPIMSCEELASFFSRVHDAFQIEGKSNHVRYLIKDSMACTFACKHKFRSRAAAYKRFGYLRKSQFPLEDKDRVKRFKAHRPIFNMLLTKTFCINTDRRTGKKKTCFLLEQAKKEILPHRRYGRPRQHVDFVKLFLDRIEPLSLPVKTKPSK
jgi:Type II intron maturase